jgi:uncharacterized protein YaaQ
LIGRYNVKLVLTVVHDDDTNEVVDALLEHGFYVTRLPSTGGFLRAGNTVLLSGIDDDRVDQMLEVIQTRAQIHVGPPASHTSQKIQTHRAVAFVLGLERLERL